MFDDELSRIGATRGERKTDGSDDDIKSVARIVGCQNSVRDVDDSWITPYVYRTCRLPGPNGKSHVLGVDLGTETAASSQFDDRTSDCIDLHRAINSIGDVGAELVLTRRCANSCKIANLLRAAGPEVTGESTQVFDIALNNTVSRTVGGHLSVASLNQSALGTHFGGLGLRKSSDLKLPAFIASRAASKALVFRSASSLNDFDMLPETFEVEFFLYKPQNDNNNPCSSIKLL